MDALLSQLPTETTKAGGLPSTGIKDVMPRPSLLRLPNEIISHIFHQLRDLRVDGLTGSINHLGQDDTNRAANKKAIANSRMACRDLHDAATRYFHPVVDVRLDRWSLEKLEAIFSGVAVCGQAVAVQVDLSYRQKLTACCDGRYDEFVNDLGDLHLSFYAHIEKPWDLAHADPQKRLLL